MHHHYYWESRIQFSALKYNLCISEGPSVSWKQADPFSVLYFLSAEQIWKFHFCPGKINPLIATYILQHRQDILNVDRFRSLILMVLT